MSDAHDNIPTSAGPAIGRRGLIIGGALLGCAIATALRMPFRRQPAIGGKAIEAMIPKQIGAWGFQSKSGLVLPPPDQLRDEIYSSLLTRTYTRPDGPNVMLLLAYSGSQDGILQVHRPEICYPASGYTLSDIHVGTMRIGHNQAIPAKFMNAASRMRNEQILYWTRIGDEFPTEWIDQRLAVARANLRQEIPDGILARISTSAPDWPTAEATLTSFSEALVRSLPAAARTLLFGEGR